MNYKKIISLASIILLTSITGLSYGQDNNTSSGYNTPIITDEFDFKADLESDGSVELSWDKIDFEGSLKYYKVVRSSINSEPVYPDDGYIKYSSEPDFLEYTDYSPNSGTNYYRICLITNENDRYCSPTEDIYIENSNYNDYNENEDNYEQEYKEKIKVKKENKNYLNSQVKTSLNNMIKNFINKLEDKYESSEDRIDIINNVIDKLEDLADNKSSLKASIEYLIDLLEQYIDKYEETDGIEQLNEIFENF